MCADSRETSRAVSQQVSTFLPLHFGRDKPPISEHQVQEGITCWPQSPSAVIPGEGFHSAKEWRETSKWRTQEMRGFPVPDFPVKNLNPIEIWTGKSSSIMFSRRSPRAWAGRRGHWRRAFIPDKLPSATTADGKELQHMKDVRRGKYLLWADKCKCIHTNQLTWRRLSELPSRQTKENPKELPAAPQRHWNSFQHNYIQWIRKSKVEIALTFTPLKNICSWVHLWQITHLHLCLACTELGTSAQSSCSSLWDGNRTEKINVDLLNTPSLTSMFW